MRLSFRAFAIVERSGRGAVLETRKRSEVAGSQRPPIEPTRPVQVAVDTPKITRDRGEASDASEPVNVVEVVEAPADLSDKRRCQDSPEAMHAQQQLCFAVTGNLVCDLRVDLGQVSIDLRDPSGELGHR